MIVREPELSDAEALKEVKALAVAPLRQIYRPAQAGFAERAAKDHRRRPFVCEHEGRVVATVEIEDRRDTYHLVGPLVHPDFQRQGIARLLIDYIAEIAREQGKQALSLNTVKQTGNVEIFSRLGFQVVSESVADGGLGESLINEPLIDVYMERNLIQSMKDQDIQLPEMTRSEDQKRR